MLKPMLEKTDPFFHLLDHSTLSGGGFILRDPIYNSPALAKETSVLALRVIEIPYEKKIS